MQNEFDGRRIKIALKLEYFWLRQFLKMVVAAWRMRESFRLNVLRQVQKHFNQRQSGEGK